MITSEPGAGDPVRIGLLVPMTGLASLYGEEITRAARIAAGFVNAEGGIQGRHLELVVADDGSLPESGVAAARDLIDGGCIAIIGNLLSNTRLAVCEQVADPRRIPMLNFSFYEGSINSRYFFHFAALPNQQIDRMIPYMARRFGPKMYFAGNNYEWPRGSVHAAMASLQNVGGEVLAEEYLPLGVSGQDVTALADRLAASGADVFVPYFAGQDQIDVLDAFAKRGLKDRMAVVMAHFDAEMAGQLAPVARDGLFASNTYFMTLETDDNTQLLQAVADYPGVSGVWPEGNGTVTNFGEGAFLCVRAFAAAASAAPSLDREPLLEALEQVQVDSAQGHVAMDAALHHAAVNSYLARCDAAGRFEIVERFGLIPPQVPARYRSLFPSDRPAQEQHRDSGEDFRRGLALEAAFQATDAALIVIAPGGEILMANSRAGVLFGYEAADLVGHSSLSLFPPAQRSQLQEVFKQSARQESQLTIPGYRADGTYMPLDLQVSGVEVDGRSALVLTALDVTSREQAELEIRWRAAHDALTGLPNRYLISERLESAVMRAKQSGQRVAVLFFDLDGFKSVNDRHGHQIGDELLVQVAGRISGTLRPGDMVARLTGDEFLVVAEKLTDERQAESLARTVLGALQAPFHLDTLELRISASAGAALSSATSSDPEDLISAADLAMYAAKSHGRGSFQMFDAELREGHMRKLILQDEIASALAHGELECWFQPVVELGPDTLAGMELLLRWHSRHGEIPPSEFIPLAEATGAIIEIGDWVALQAAEAEARWRGLFGDRAPVVSFNVSPRQLSRPEFVPTLLQNAERAGARLDRMLMEITENALMDSLSEVSSSLTALTSQGMRIAIDDFGTGYSSLRELAGLPVSVLKIDRYFVNSATESSRMAGLLSSMVQMAQTLGMTAIAEGVETAEQRRLLAELGCTRAQGYLFGRPAPEPDDPFDSLSG